MKNVLKKLLNIVFSFGFFLALVIFCLILLGVIAERSKTNHINVDVSERCLGPNPRWCE